MAIHWPNNDEIANFIIGTVFLKYIVLDVFVKNIGRLFKRLMTRTEIEAITWIHYSEGAMKHGHQYKTPLVCPDGLCIRIKEKKLR